MIKTTTVANYLLQRLEEIGLKHMFSVPGDYVLDFMDNILESDITLIGNGNELNAGYAAKLPSLKYSLLIHVPEFA